MPLSVIVDRVAADHGGQRNEDFVRHFSDWMRERAALLELELVEQLGLEDVVVTFRMKGSVDLLVTGYPPEPLPGSVTLTVEEADFPRVNVTVRDAPRERPYDICTMDYSWAGRPVRVVSGPLVGREGHLIVAATINDRQENRVRLDDGRKVKLSGDDLELL